MDYNKELLNRFLTEKVAIALRTQEEWNEFMELLEDETDAKWGTSEKPKQFNSWEIYREETSITYQFEGCRSLRYGSCAYLEELGCKIVEFKELIKEKEMNYNKELLNRFLTEKVAIALRTKDEWNTFMGLLEKETDLVWSSGHKPTELNYWEDYKEETVIDNNFKHSDLDYRGLGYGDVSSYKSFDYEIIEFKELVKEREMNLAYKLRFLADRMEDGKEFYIDDLRYSLDLGGLIIKNAGIESKLQINDLKKLDLKLAPKWTFTEDEKVILRNLPEKYEWIARDEDGHLCVYAEKPIKGTNWWWLQVGHYHFNAYKHLFQSIQWSDKEPCEFRKYL